MQTTPQCNDRSDAVSRTKSQKEVHTRARLELVHHLLGGRVVAFNGLPQVLYWAVTGILLGYPHCCIEDFVARATGKRPYDVGPRILHGTGIKPCEACSASFADDTGAFITIINLQRHTAIPDFPVEDNERLLKIVRQVYEREFNAPRS